MRPWLVFLDPPPILVDNADEFILNNGIGLFKKIKQQSTKLLINEDHCLLKSAFEVQSELYKQITNKSQSIILKLTSYLVIILSILIVLSLLNAYDVITITFTIQLTTALIVLSMSIFFALNRNPFKAFNDQFEQLVKQINLEKQKLKKLRELIEDNWNYSNSNEKRLKKLKTTFRDVGLKCLYDFRDCTLFIKNKLPLKNDIDDNLISALPDDLFESYNNDDDLNAKGLKSLHQLIRLQISEFFKRFLLLFVQNYYIDLSLFNNLHAGFFANNVNLLEILIDNSKKREHEILSILSFHKSFYEQNDLFTCNPSLNENENKTLWLTLRNIRKTLYLSLSIIEECESTFEQNKHLDDQVKLTLNSKLEILFENFSFSRDAILNLQKSLHHNIASNKNLRLTENPKFCRQDSIHSNRVLLIQENDPPKDEVFEAYIEDVSNNQKLNIRNEDLDLDMESIRVTENNFFSELKTALKDKAIEHKMREAKALGLSIDKEQIESEYQLSTNKTKNRCSNYINIIPKHLGMMNATDDDSGHLDQKNLPGRISPMNSEIIFNVAMKAANKMKLSFNVQEDTFGDDTDEQEVNEHSN